jgi:hypothetical protein
MYDQEVVFSVEGCVTVQHQGQQPTEIFVTSYVTG